MEVKNVYFIFAENNKNTHNMENNDTSGIQAKVISFTEKRSSFIRSLEEKIVNDIVIKDLIDLNQYSFGYITGGAILSIADGLEPRDYDITGNTMKVDTLVGLGFVFVRETKTAKTFHFKGKLVQFLKTDVKDFDYTISMSTVDLGKGRNRTINNFDFNSYITKDLVPNPESFINKSNAVRTLSRLPHYLKKNYRLDDTTYLSLLAVASQSNKIQANS